MSTTVRTEMPIQIQQAERFIESPASMDRRRFIELYGGIYEHSPWVAEQLFDRGLSRHEEQLDGMADALSAVVDEAGKASQLELLCAHPDLAGRAALAGDLTAVSSGEQSGAGLDHCSQEELEEFRYLNRRYQAKFGFPFIVAVKGLDRQQILECFRRRLDNGGKEEYCTALIEVHKIARLRLKELCDG